MNSAKLSSALNAKARKIGDDVDPKTGRCSDDAADTAELLRVLARIVAGKSIARSFGAPGDWGYDTDIGQALAAEPIPDGIQVIPLSKPDDIINVHKALEDILGE